MSTGSLASALQAIARPLGRVNQWVGKAAVMLAAALLAAMVVMVIAQVFFRYVLNDSLGWTEELAKYLMVWVACLVAPWAYRENLNVSIQMFSDALPGLVRQWVEILITMLVIFICGIFLRESLAFWRSGLTMMASSMPVNLALFYSCAPFAFASVILVGVEKWLLQIADTLPSQERR